MKTADNLCGYVKEQVWRIKSNTYIQWYLNCRSRVPIIVYQMGKVGSSSIRDSLKSGGIHPVFHVHRMNPRNIEAVRNTYLRRGQKALNEGVGVFLYKNICQKNKKAKFITIVREPISRNMSAFFQNYEIFTGCKYKATNFQLKELIDLFLSHYSHDVPLTWFDVEMKEVLGIDVYRYPFPKEIGYVIIREGSFEILLFKVEISDAIKEKAISEFLDITDFRLKRHNVARDKEYSETYKDFKQAISMPYSYVKQMCDSKYTKHFYSATEIEMMWSAWYNKQKRMVADA